MEAFKLHLKTECVNFKVTPPPTHRKEVDPKKMTVTKLRSELKRRGESTKVEVKTILAERVQKARDEEKRKESEASSLVFFYSPDAPL